MTNSLWWRSEAAPIANQDAHYPHRRARVQHAFAGLMF
jgi:hypothetical protein